MPIVHQLMGNIFYRGVTPQEIKEMDYKELKYWSEWHNVFCKEESKDIEKVIK